MPLRTFSLASHQIVAREQALCLGEKWSQAIRLWSLKLGKIYVPVVICLLSSKLIN